jgi:NAD(P)-dependent dehydrogenase (short-subunit alcohol dehydrogenase family)
VDHCKAGRVDQREAMDQREAGRVDQREAMDQREAGRAVPRVAVITGAGTGIGAAVTRRLAAGGTAVVMVGRRLQPLLDVAAPLGDRALALAADAASTADMAGVVEAARSRFGGVDTLIANAGGLGAGTAAEIADDSWSDSLRSNLTTCLVSARACLPDLMRRQGSVVVISSIAGLAAAPESVGYVTSKHGLIGLARSMARDFGRHGVRVNTVCPGWVRTPMADEEMDQLARLRGLPDRDAAYALATAQVPLRRPAEPDEIAAVVAFLASSDASAMTGAVVTVDCGATAVDLPTTAFDPS